MRMGSTKENRPWPARPLTTLITGASSGIGEALACASASRGETLFLCGRDRARLEAVAEKCRAAGSPRVETEILDVADPVAMSSWFACANAIAPIDRVFANAGVGTGVEDEANVRRTFATNVNGVVNAVLPAIAAFRASGRGGQILITASIAGYGPLATCPAYSATKSCMKTWALALRGMLRKEGIRVSAICPGFVRSRITDRNTCPMPFFLEADRAARIILRRADRNVGLIAFPWPMRLATWFLSILPWRLNEFVNSFLPEKTAKATPTPF